MLSSVLIGGPALAQGEAARRVDLDASARIQYDSNVVLSDPRVSNGRGKGDFSLVPSLNANIFLPRATGDLYLNGSIGYNFYRRYSSLNRESINLTGGVDQRFANCSFNGEVQYGRSLNDLANLLVTENAQSFNNAQERRTYSADIGCGGTIGLRPSIGISRTEVRNSATLRQIADSNVTNFTGQLGYQSPTMGTVSVFGRYGNSVYLHRPLVNGQRDGTESYAAGLQLERAVGVRLNFVGSVNYTRVDPKLAGTSGFSGVGYDLTALYRGPLFNLAITGSRSAQPSQILYVAYDIRTSIGADISRKFTERLSASAGATYQRRNFQSSSAFSDTKVDGEDEQLSFNAGVAYRAARRLRFSLDASHRTRTSNLQLYKFDANRVSLTTSLSL